MEEVEEWRDIEDVPNYMISNMGNIRHKKEGGKNRKLCKNNGYWVLRIKTANECCTMRIHRLVAKAFVPNPDPLTKTEVNHLNGKDDNRACSLTWVTPAENMAHYYATNQRPKKVKLRISDGIESEEYDSIYKAAQAFGIDPTTMWGASLNGKIRHLTIERIPIY